MTKRRSTTERSRRKRVEFSPRIRFEGLTIALVFFFIVHLDKGNYKCSCFGA
jgi:hypothetical protein